MIKNLTYSRSQFDIPLLISTALIVAFGLLMIYDASVVAAFRDFGDKLYYFKNQLIWASVGFISLFIFSFIDYHKLVKAAPIFFAIALALLVIVLIPPIGSKIYGARRWIVIGSFSLQPSEFAKLALILYQTFILIKFQNFTMKLLDVAYVLFLPTILLTGLVLLEPDLGTALVFVGISAFTYFVAGGPLWHFLMMIPALIAAAVVAIATKPYRIERLKAFIDPNYDPQGASYQINQILISLASGGLLGVGLGGARGKFDFIPEVHSDAIFAVVAEEIGFVGSTLVIGLLLLLI
ncbi:MAG: cell division protein FtsW, partial [Microgenomates group bacterium Gr01-1014_93]